MVENLGARELMQIVLTLRIHPSGVAVADGSERTLASLLPGCRALVSWKLRAVLPGN
jgi:hypothetical protein